LGVDVSNANEMAFPHWTSGDYHIRGGLTKLEYFAALNWTQDEIDSVAGYTVRQCAAFVGVSVEDYLPEVHYRIAACKARVVLARTLLAELEKPQ
jgi:hypothetical protein